MARRPTRPIRSTLLKKLSPTGKWEARVLDRTTSTDKKGRHALADGAVAAAVKKGGGALGD